MAKIIDGRIARKALEAELVGKISGLRRKPTLAIFQVGDREDSSAFIKAKKVFAEKIGVKEAHIRLPEKISQQELDEIISRYSLDTNIDGMILQLPLPAHLNSEFALERIDPLKDADALAPLNVKKWKVGDKNALLPATARGIRELLKYYEIPIKGKKVTVVGRSALVGTPISVMCKSEGAEVTVCHRGTLDLAAETRNADILIVAAGSPGLIKPEHVNPKMVVIDVGITRTLEEALVGDVDFESVKDIVAAISPVPGGVGPMTVLALFENLVDLSLRADQ